MEESSPPFDRIVPSRHLGNISSEKGRRCGVSVKNTTDL
jgi:hypothetical protein